MQDPVHELQLRSSPEHRQALGSWFTADDVSEHIARSAIIPAWAHALHARLLHSGSPAATLQLCAQVDAAALRPGQLSAYAAQLAAGLSDRERVHAQDVLRELQILDPCVGAGAFCLAAWRVLSEIGQLVDAACSPSQLHGIDVDQAAVTITLDRLREVAGPGSEIRQGDATEPLLAQLPALARYGGADVVIGNPPWVVHGRSYATPHTELTTARCPNIYAWIIEQSLHALNPGGYLAQVVPISSVCSPAFAPLRSMLDHCERVDTTHFDTIPSSLFDAVQRLTIITARTHAQIPAGDQSAQWRSSRYHRWLSAEREHLLGQIQLVPAPPALAALGNVVPKVGTHLEADLVRQLTSMRPLTCLLADTGTEPVYYKRRWSYFLLFLDCSPPIYDETMQPRAPSECKLLYPAAPLTRDALIALLSSTLFWWYFSVFTDNRNVNRREIEAFPVPGDDHDAITQLTRLGRELMAATHEHSELRRCQYKSIGTIYNTYYHQSETRPIIDQIDRVLAQWYGLDAAQAAFIEQFEHRFRSC